MAFESISDKLQDVFKKLRSKGKITESDLKAAMREVKLALLEADVNFKVVKDFIANVSQKAMGEAVLESLTPGQQVIKIVNEELTALMGSEVSKIRFSSKPPTVIMMVGLQGAGKTTTCAKVGKILKKDGKRPILVAADVYRPAARQQLKVVGSQVEIPVFSIDDCNDPVEISKKAIDHAQLHGNDLVIIDTAGRLHIDDELMAELENIKASVEPTEILLVIDAMTGQDAVNVASSFDERLSITGTVLTKMDGDTRGGAALSVKAVTGKPIKFAGMGEKLSDLDYFYPDRMASRILGMGDVLTLIDKAQQAFDEKKAAELEKKIRKNKFTLEDFLEQMGQIKKMGGVAKMLDMMPGMNSKAMKGLDIQKSEKEFAQMEAIILSMTKEERENPSILNASRRKRISAGCGQPVSKINQLIKRYEESKKMMKSLTGKGGMGRMGRMFRGF